MSAPVLVSARDGGWQSIAVRVMDNVGLLCSYQWHTRPAWVCAHGTVWVGPRPPSACECTVPLPDGAKGPTR